MSQYTREHQTTSLEVIEFYLDEKTADGSSYRSYYGMNVAKVLEIIRMPANITAMPGKQHEASMGTFNLRDRVMPLVNLGLWLKKDMDDGEGSKVIVSEFSGIVAAFVVSGVTRIHRMNWGQVEPPGKYLQYFSHDSVTGVVRFDERIVFLLDMEQIISSMNPSLGLDHSAAAMSGDPETGRGRKILIADDSAVIRKVLSSTLTASGYAVFQATCGREAWMRLEKWKHQADAENLPLNHFIDLIISDIEMPEMDGHELTHKIKSDAALQNVPVVLFSSLISDVVREAGRKAGADDQISKPDLPYLAVRIKELIDRNSRPEA
jgi:two-component system chemotaxis response regulator CheV